MSVENVDPCVDRPNIIKLRSVILSIMLETGYAEVDIENAMSINGDDFVKSFKWLRDHCVRDHSDESDEADDMFDGYGDGVGYGDDDFDY